MFDWDIEPDPRYKEEPRFRVVHLKPGLGRFHTRGEAARRSGEIRGRCQHDKIAARWRNVQRHVERMRDAVL